MKKLILLTFLGLGLVVSSFAQQLPQYSFFGLNEIQRNPAVSGARNTPSVQAVYRNQWLGFEGAPVNQYIAFDTPFEGKRVGMNVQLQHAQIGVERRWNLGMGYSYSIPLSPQSTLSAGLSASLQYFGFDFSDETAVVNRSDDPSILNNLIVRQYRGNVGAGLYYTYAKKFYAGLSVPSLYPTTYGAHPDLNVPTAKQFYHVYGSMGANLAINEAFALRPNILVTYVENAPTDINLNTHLVFKDELSIGVGYGFGGDRQGDAISALLFYQASPKLGIGCAFDFGISMLRSYNAGTAEIMLRYDLKTERSDLENPRFFN